VEGLSPSLLGRSAQADDSFDEKNQVRLELFSHALFLVTSFGAWPKEVTRRRQWS